MLSCLELIKAWPGEEVVVRYDHESGAWMFIAIHATHGTRAVGGCRLKQYPTLDDSRRCGNEALLDGWFGAWS